MSEMGGTRHHFTRAGRLVASKQIVYSIAGDSQIRPVSNFLDLTIQKYSTKNLQAQSLDVHQAISDEKCVS